MSYENWRKWLFAPGPVMTSKEVKQAMTIPDLCHRGSFFESLLHELRQKIVRLYKGNDEYTSVILSGSGTAANECVISSIFAPEDELLVLSNGEFGERLAHIAQIYHIPTHILNFGWAHPIAIEKIPKTLEKHPHISMIAMVYHETSTSMINPVKEVGKIAREYGKLFFVDAISAIGGEPVNVVDQNIDFCTGTPNKAIGGMPGLSFVCFAKRLTTLGTRALRRNEYLNLFAHIQMADEKNQTPHTPAVPLFPSLSQALDEVFQEGLEKRIARYSRCASIIRTGVRSLSLETLIPDNIASNTVTTVLFPIKYNVKNFIELLDQQGYVVYPGKGPLLDLNAFQIANMGQIYEKDCEEFLRTFEKAFRHFIA